MPGVTYRVPTATAPRHSLSDGSEEEEEGGACSGPSPLDRLTAAMCSDEKTIKELVAGRRVGFYKIHGEIGQGSFSRVKRASHALTRDTVAIKVLEKARLDLQAQRLLYREVWVMERLAHPNLVRLYEVLETPSRLFLVLEYAGGGDLQQRIASQGKMSDRESRVTFAQMVYAVRYMHQNNIVHRDLKAENVLFARGSSLCVKVADFGFSASVPDPRAPLDTFCGSPPYAAPELFGGGRSYLGPPVDVWALGVLLFFMVTGALPFRADTLGKLRRCVLAGAFSVPPAVPPPCARLITGILRPAPDERYALDQMLGCDWLLPVETLWAAAAVAAPEEAGPLRLLGGSGELKEEEEEVRAAMEELGVTREHIRIIDHARASRSPVTGLYRILLHAAQKRRGPERVPTLRGMVRDPRREGLRAYQGLRHVSKLCVLS